VFLHGRFLH